MMNYRLKACGKKDILSSNNIIHKKYASCISVRLCTNYYIITNQVHTLFLVLYGALTAGI